jgi:uncharacterized membrane protein
MPPSPFDYDIPVNTLILAIFLGVGLAASAGLNAFLPLLLLSAAAHFHIGGITLSTNFAWLGSDVALAVLLVATLLELIADKVPAADHALHMIGMFVRPVAGVIATASVLTSVDPVTGGIIAIILGAPTSLAFHAAKTSVRLVSSAATLGCGNPFLSLIEDFVSFTFAVVSLFAPVLVPLLIVAAIVFFAALYRSTRRPPTGAPAG